MPFKLRFYLWFYNTFRKINTNKITPAQFRKLSDEFKDDNYILDGPTIPLHKVENKEIDGSLGKIPIRIFHPTDEANLPVIIYFHGGGFVIGTLDSHDNICRRISRDNEAIVVSVGYRLAPEHKYPAAPTDCYDATVWVANNCATFGGDADRLIVMGDSAGGNLATVVARKARDLNGPKILYQVLVYPCTDARLCHPSIDRNGDGFILTKKMMRWFLNHYIVNDDQLVESSMSPLLVKDLTNLPPALIQVAEFDPLIDEGIAYAKRLREAGNRVQLTEYKGLIHTYFTMPKFSKKCLAAYQEIQEVLKKELALALRTISDNQNLSKSA